MSQIKQETMQEKARDKPPLLRIVVIILIILAILFAGVVVFANRSPEVMEIDGFYCVVNSRGNLTIVGLNGMQRSTTLLIPDTLEGKAVDELASGAFSGSQMKNFIVPSTINKIGKNAFDGEGVFYIYMVGRKDLAGMDLEENWSGVGEVIFQDVNPQISIPPAIQDVEAFTGNDADKSESRLQIDGEGGIGEELPDLDNGTGGTSSSTGTDGSNGEDELINEQNKQLERIDILNPPAKTAYIEGEPFDSAGMIVKAVYSNGFQQLVTGYSYSRASLSSSDTSVLISYSDNGTKSARVPISVERKRPVRLAITSPPTKTTYVELDKFDPDGMVVKVQYNNGSVRTITPSIADKSLTLNQVSIIFTYVEGGVTVSAEQPITVIQKKPSSLSIITPPQKVNYTESNDFEPMGIILEVKYNNGEKARIAEKDITYNKEKLKEGQKSVTITYRENGAEVSAEQPITVIRRVPVKLELTSPPAKTAYIEQELFNPTGIKAKVTYNNGETAEVTPTHDTSELRFGQTEINIYYMENGETAKTTQAITVRKRLPISLTITAPPSETGYIEQELFNPADMVVTAGYDNGKSEIVSGYTYSKAPLVFGQASITISYEENGEPVTATQAITVRKRLPISLAITTPPTKTEYIEAELFTPAGMVVKATYDNHKTEAVTGYTYSTDPVTFGQTEVVISYEENGKKVTAGQAIAVRKRLPIALTIVTPPTTTSYIEGAKFNPLGLTVRVVYDNGQSGMVTPSFPDEKLKAGQAFIVLSYTENGRTTTVNLPITVINKIPIALHIKHPPTKVTYSAGQKFKPAGMVVEVEYNNGDRSETTGYTYDNVQLRQGQTSVVIRYSETIETAAAKQASVSARVQLLRGAAPNLATYERYEYKLATCAFCRGLGKTGFGHDCDTCNGTGKTGYNGECRVSYCDDGKIFLSRCSDGCYQSVGSYADQQCIYGTGHKIEWTENCDVCGGDSYVDNIADCKSCKATGRTAQIISCVSCNGNGNNGMKRGDNATEIKAVDGYYPKNGLFEDGYWYIRKDKYIPTKDELERAASAPTFSEYNMKPFYELNFTKGEASA